MAGRSGSFDLGNVALHEYVEFEPEHFDLARMNAALGILIKRHPMLRAVVVPDGMQRVVEHVPDYTIEVVDLRGRSQQERSAILSAERERMSHRMFDLTVWPWFEIRAFRLEENRHRMLLSCDEVMLDAWSSYLILREFSALLDDENAPLPPLDLTFRDFMIAGSGKDKTPGWRRARDYWSARLGEIPPPPALPLSKSPEMVTRPRFARRMMRLTPDEWSRFQQRAGEGGLTPGVSLIAAYAEIVARWSQSRRFTLNLPIFNRPPVHLGINNVVGHFTTLSLLAVDLGRAESFLDHALAIQRQLRSDLDHRDYGGVQVMRDLRHHEGGEAFGAPIVATNIMLKEGFQSSLRGRVEYAITQAPQVLLEQIATVSDGGLLLCWDAVEELFPAGVLDEMFGAFSGFISRLAADEGNWKASQSSVSIPAKHLPETAQQSAELLHTLFLKQVPIRGDAPAVISSSRTLGYRELHRRAMWVARRLREHGAGPNTLVAIVTEKGWEQVVAALGILYAGAAYLPIEAKVPAERLAYLLQHGEVRIALTQSHITRQISWPGNVRHLCVDEGFEDAGAFDFPRPRIEDLAYVIYTSGSTGQPKGVMIDHRGAVNTVLDINGRFQVTAEDRVLALSSLSFDLSVYDVFGMLAAGGAIVIPDADGTLDPAHWASLILREKVTIWNTVPALMNLFAEYAAQLSCMAANKLRLAMLSGDWIPLTLPDQIRALSPDARVISLGGATEASIWSILYPVEKVDAAWKSIPYGRAMVNQSFHVFDSAMDDCPAWVVGELYIGGIGLARGYWRDAEKTAVSFVRHPRTGEPLYRTGDLGRWLPDGNIEFLGRKDFQVKIQGFRIELEEIEAALLQHPALAAVVVTARGGRHENKRLVACVVPKSAAPSISEMREFLLQKLPAYMVPSAFIILERLPLSSNGKVDRSALPEVLPLPESEPTSREVDAVSRITAIVERVLKIGRIEPHADLINLGATSLNIISIVNVIERELQFRPNLAEFFRVPTITCLVRGFAAAPESLRRSGHAPAAGRETGVL